MTCSWHGAAPVSPSAPWYLGRDSQSRGILTAAEHHLTLYSVILLKNSTGKESAISVMATDSRLGVTEGEVPMLSTWAALMAPCEVSLRFAWGEF